MQIIKMSKLVKHFSFVRFIKIYAKNKTKYKKKVGYCNDLITSP